MQFPVSAPEFPSDQRETVRREDHYVLEDLPENDRMLYGAVAYVCFPVSIYYARWDPFVRYHVRQGACLAIGWVLARIFSTLSWSNEVPELGIFGYAAVTVLTCQGIYHALSLEMRPVKFVGRLFDRFPLPKKLAET